MADWMLDPPDDYEDDECESDDYDDRDDSYYDEDEAAANASSDWENSRGYY